MTWLCAVISTGEASGEGNIMLCIIRVVVGDDQVSVVVRLMRSKRTGSVIV